MWKLTQNIWELPHPIVISLVRQVRYNMITNLRPLFEKFLKYFTTQFSLIRCPFHYAKGKRSSCFAFDLWRTIGVRADYVLNPESFAKFTPNSWKCPTCHTSNIINDLTVPSRWIPAVLYLRSESGHRFIILLVLSFVITRNMETC